MFRPFSKWQQQQYEHNPNLYIYMHSTQLPVQAQCFQSCQREPGQPAEVTVEADDPEVSPGTGRSDGGIRGQRVHHQLPQVGHGGQELHVVGALCVDKIVMNHLFMDEWMGDCVDVKCGIHQLPDRTFRAWMCVCPCPPFPASLPADYLTCTS